MNQKRGSSVPVILTGPAALTRTNRENKNVKCNISYVLFSCCFWPRLCIKSNARISLNIGVFFPTELFDKGCIYFRGTYQKEGSEGQHIWIGTPKVNSKKNVGQCGFMQQQSRFFLKNVCGPEKGR